MILKMFYVLEKHDCNHVELAIHAYVNIGK